MKQYDDFIAQLARLHAGEPAVAAQLSAMTVTEEDWDKGRGGGHLQIHVPDGLAPITVHTVDATATDEDGMLIEIILHAVHGRLAWGEWFRWDENPVLQWPPREVRHDALSWQLE